MSLLEQVRSADAQTRKAALQTYLELVARDEDPQHGDREELFRVMEILGLSTEDVHADVYAVHNARRIQRETPSADEIERRQRELEELTAGEYANLRALLLKVIEGLPVDRLDGVWRYLETLTMKNVFEKSPEQVRVEQITRTVTTAQTECIGLANSRKDADRQLSELRARQPRVAGLIQ